MKNKINSIIAKVGIVLAACFMFASFSPSLDGRAVVVDEGVFPQGLFAKTVGYLPGDIISVANITGETTVDLLVIGALDPSEGVAIMLSPEAASAIGIDKDANNIVKITKRSGQDERVYGTAIIAKQNISTSKAEDEPVISEETADAFESVAEDEFQEETQEAFAEDDAAQETTEETDAAAEDEEEALTEESDEAVEEEAVPDYEEENAVPEEESSEENEEYTDEYEDEAEEAFEEEPVESDVKSYEETEGEYEDEYEEEAVVEESDEDDDESEVAEETEEPLEEESEDFDEETIAEPFKEEDMEADLEEEAVEAETLEELEDETEVAEVAEEDVSVENELVEEDSEEDELDAVIESELEEYDETFATDEDAEEEYEAIVLVPVDSIAPEYTEEDEVEVVAEENNEEPAEETSVVVIEPVKPKTSAVPKTSYDKYMVGSLGELKSGKSYIQIAALSADENIMEIVNKYGNNYPITIVPMAGGIRKQILIGPLSVDEYAVVLARFKSYGYKDAFLRKIK